MVVTNMNYANAMTIKFLKDLSNAMQHDPDGPRVFPLGRSLVAPTHTSAFTAQYANKIHQEKSRAPIGAYIDMLL